MKDPRARKQIGGGLRGFKRKPVRVTRSDVVTIGRPPGESCLPLSLEPSVDGIDLLVWSAENRPLVEDLLWRHSALLFRGFRMDSVKAFAAFVRLTSDGEPLAYRDRTTPRTTKGDRIYTSTVYPADQRINPHNEGTYWLQWALKLYFCCVEAAEVGGETPLADVRKVYERIDPAIRGEFEAKKMMLVRNYNQGFGLPWQEVYQTDDKAELEAYCRENLIDFEWRGGDRLSTRQVRPAVRRHPKTGADVWFNHAAFFHYTTLEPDLREALVEEFGVEHLPYNTYYGDGTSIEAEVVEHIRQAYEAEKVMFPWKAGDVLLLDNMSVAHGREPYQGAREVLAAMTEPYAGAEGVTISEIDDRAR